MKKGIVLVSAFLIVFLLCGAVSAAKTNIDQISTKKINAAATSSDQRNPDISGNRVVWQQKDSSGHYAIYYKNLARGKTVRVQPTTKNQYNPAISGTKIVWEQKNSFNVTNIYYKDLASGSVKAVMPSKLNQFSPDISGNIIVWEAWKYVKDYGYNKSVYYKNLSSGYSGNVKQSTENQVEPAVDGNIVVWTESDQIHTKNLATGKYGRVAYTGNTDHNPQISGTRVVWSGYFYELSVLLPDRVYLKDLATGHSSVIRHWKPSKNSPQYSPSISGNRIAYVEKTYLKGDIYDASIYIFNISNGKIVKVKTITSIQNQNNPAISGTTVVWEQKLIKSSQHRIYYKNLVTGKYSMLS